jgi:hypothetical protein
MARVAIITRENGEWSRREMKLIGNHTHATVWRSDDAKDTLIISPAITKQIIGIALDDFDFGYEVKSGVKLVGQLRQ